MHRSTAFSHNIGPHLQAPPFQRSLSFAIQLISAFKKKAVNPSQFGVRFSQPLLTDKKA
jgi:hypothetical protein